MQASDMWYPFAVSLSATCFTLSLRFTGTVQFGSRRTVAKNLPVGLAGGPGMPPPYGVTGIAVHNNGVIYMLANPNNAIDAILAPAVTHMPTLNFLTAPTCAATRAKCVVIVCTAWGAWCTSNRSGLKSRKIRLIVENRLTRAVGLVK